MWLNPAIHLQDGLKELNSNKTSIIESTTNLYEVHKKEKLESNVEEDETKKKVVDPQLDTIFVNNFVTKYTIAHIMSMIFTEIHYQFKIEVETYFDCTGLCGGPCGSDCLVQPWHTSNVSEKPEKDKSGKNYP